MNDTERDKTLQETHDNVIQIKERLRVNHEEIQDLKLTVYGDGREATGLRSRTTILETNQRARDENVKEGRKWRGWAATSLIVLVASILTAIAERYLR